MRCRAEQAPGAPTRGRDYTSSENGAGQRMSTISQSFIQLTKSGLSQLLDMGQFFPLTHYSVPCSYFAVAIPHFDRVQPFTPASIDVRTQYERGSCDSYSTRV